MAGLKRTLTRTLTGISHTTLELRYKLCSEFGRESGIKSEQRDVPIVVSLATIPERLGKVHIAVESLLRQTLKPNRIILWMSESQAGRTLPFVLRNQMRRGLEIRFVVDIGPYGKAIYALKEQTNNLVVTADDDTIYPPRWLEQLVKAYQQETHCVHCHRARWMTTDKDRRLRPYTEWDLLAQDYISSSLLLFPTGVGGILYPPGVLHPEVFNDAVFRKICSTADDIWFKAMSLLNGVPCKKVSFFHREFPQVRGTQTKALWKENLKEGRNDIQLRAVFEHYDLYARLMNTQSGSLIDVNHPQTRQNLSEVLRTPIP